MDKFMRVPLKYISLWTLILQNSALILVMRYSRTLDGPQYLPQTAVVLSELVKFVICSIIYIMNDLKGSLTPHKIIRDFRQDWIKMVVPAVLYLVQNNLQYIAVSLLDAATFQVTYQLKILTTALFSVMMLKKVLTLKKWFSLAILTVGIAVVQLDGAKLKNDDDKSSISGHFFGLIAVFIACCISGLAGVW
jgi:UDP-sugar transporter A1/2/3